MPFLSVIIPTYNEEQRIGDTLALVRDYLERQSFTTEVLVVDDGSQDGTVAIVEEVAKRFPAIRLIANTVNRGKGVVVQQGMLEATGDYRLFMDADSSTSIHELDSFIPLLGAYDVIIGSRYLRPGSVKVKQPLHRRAISRTGNWLIQHTVLPGVIDTQCGFKLFTAKAAEAIFARQTITGWVFDVEILTIAHQLGLTIHEVAVDWYDAKESKLRAAHAAWKSLRDIRTIRDNVRRGDYRKPPQSTHG